MVKQKAMTPDEQIVVESDMLQRLRGIRPPPGSERKVGYAPIVVPIGTELRKLMDATDALKVVELLNQAVAFDRLALEELLGVSVDCKFKLGKVLPVRELSKTECYLGTLGILNGVLELLTGRRMLAHFEHPGDGTTKLTHFQLAEPGDPDAETCL